MLRYTVALVALIVVLFFAFVPRGCSCTPRWKAYQAAARSDLRNLVGAEEGFFAAETTYTSDLERLRFTPSIGVRLRVVESSDSGFVAVAIHEQNDGRCVMHYGRVALRPVIGDTVGQAGEPYCDMRKKGE